MIPLLSSQDTIKMEFPRPLTRQETDPDLPRVSRSLWQRHGSAVASRRVGGTECSSACRGLLKEVSTIFITSTVVWTQIKEQGGNTAPSVNRKLD